MTLHPVRLNGLVIGVPQTFSYFDKMQERIINFVSENSKISPERLRDLMTATGGLMTDIGSILDGKEAVGEGIINATGGLHDAIEKLNALIDEREQK